MAVQNQMILWFLKISGAKKLQHQKLLTNEDLIILRKAAPERQARFLIPQINVTYISGVLTIYKTSEVQLGQNIPTDWAKSNFSSGLAHPKNCLPTDLQEAFQLFVTSRVKAPQYSSIFIAVGTPFVFRNVQLFSCMSLTHFHLNDFSVHVDGRPQPERKTHETSDPSFRWSPKTRAPRLSGKETTNEGGHSSQ